MTDALIAVTTLLLPWLALYLAAGIVLGPLLLQVMRLRHGLHLRLLSDTATAIVAWPGVGAWLLLTEMRIHR